MSQGGCMENNNGSAELLSVIIPNLNYGSYIADAIYSVVDQDYDPIELIVVDDGSTDDSVAIVEKILRDITRFKNVELIKLDKNIGKLGAINRAIKRISGDYCIILDSDDYLTPAYASRCITELKQVRAENTKIAFVYTDCNLVGSARESLDRGRSRSFDPVLLQEFSYVPEPAVVLTAVMLEAGPFDERIRKGTKHHKWLRIVANGWHGQHLPEALFYYRMHENNLSGIGKRVLAEVQEGQRGHRILSGYWPTATT